MRLTTLFLISLSFCCSVIGQQLPPLHPHPELADKTNIGGLQDIGLPPLVDYTNVSGNDCYCCTVVPLTLLEFKGVRIDPSMVELEWKTENEINNKGFYVERSLGNTNKFAVINFVPADIGVFATKKYKLPDPNDFSGTSFYRLRQTDIDESFTYSKTIAIKGFVNRNTIELFPNPAREKLTIRLNLQFADNVTIIISDAALKSILQQKQNVSKGANQIPLNIASLSSGTYILKLVSAANGIISSRFVVE